MTERANGEELRQFIERIERLNAEKQEAADLAKDVFAEAKGRGYCVATLRRIVLMRKKTQEQIDEEEAILEAYRCAIGM